MTVQGNKSKFNHSSSLMAKYYIGFDFRPAAMELLYIKKP